MLVAYVLDIPVMCYTSNDARNIKTTEQINIKTCPGNVLFSIYLTLDDKLCDK